MVSQESGGALSTPWGIHTPETSQESWELQRLRHWHRPNVLDSREEVDPRKGDEVDRLDVQIIREIHMGNTEFQGCLALQMGLFWVGETSCLGYQRSIGISSRGMTSWKQCCHGDLALK